MDDIYQLLPKHFRNECSEQEEKIVDQFRNEHPLEYQSLARLHDRGTIEIKEFDRQAALKKVKIAVHKNSLNKKEAKIFKFIPKWTIAMPAAALILITVGLYFLGSSILFQKNQTSYLNETNSVQKILLEDGSIVWLNKNARLTYPKHFNEAKRKVSLKGEGFFDVAKNPDQPFVIGTDYATITVLGTSFNVNSNSKTTDVSVATGKVQVESLTSSDKVYLHPGFSASATLSKITQFETSNKNYLSWKTGIFTFNETSIEQAVQDLNKYYNKEIILKDEVSCSLTANFDNADFNEILEIMQVTCDLRIESVNQQIEIYK